MSRHFVRPVAGRAVRRRAPNRRSAPRRLVACALSGLALLIGCAAEPPEAPVVVEGPNSAAETWVAPRRAESVALLSLPARVVPDARSQAVLSVPSFARVLEVRANVGELLEAGAPVAVVVLPELAEAAGSLTAARTRKRAYQRVLEQLEALGEHGLARLSDRIEAEVKLAEATAEEQVALARLSAAGVSPEQAERLASSGGRTTLRSPLAGRLAESRAVVGANVSPDDGFLARVAAVASSRVEVRVPADATAFERGTFETGSGATRVATREGCLSEVEREDGTVRCWFTLEGDPLPSQQPGRLSLTPPEGTELWAVPRASISLTPEGSFVLARKEGAAAQRVSVVVLGTTGNDTLVTGALDEESLVAAHAPAEGTSP